MKRLISASKCTKMRLVAELPDGGALQEPLARLNGDGRREGRGREKK